MSDWLLENGFMPHGHCYFWRPDILWTHVVSDAIIALAYFSIPVTLLYFLRRRPDVPFPGVIALFAAFIVLCGSGHVLEIWTVWNPIYALQGVEKAATAAVSIATALVMIPIVPQALAMRTPAQIQKEVDLAVSRLRETQDQLVQNEKMASLGALVAGVAHEISTPVGIGVTAASTLQTMSQSIERKFVEQSLTRNELVTYLAAARESSEIILRNMQRAGDLIHSFKQVAVDQTSGELRRFGLRVYIDEILLSLAPKLRKSPHRVSVVCPDTLTVTTYPGALAQVITNLVGNSLLHAFPGDRAGHIQFELTQEGDQIRLQYADDGVGIPPENLPKIFDPFFTTKRGAGGSGLGLHIVHNLVTQTLKGSIRAHSAGQGAQFLIRFACDLGGNGRSLDRGLAAA